MTIKQYFIGFFDNLYNYNLITIDLENEKIDKEIDKIKTNIDLNTPKKFENLFKQEYNNDINNTKNIIKFLKNEQIYIDKLFEFEGEIKVKNILTKTIILNLINHFELILDVEKLEKKKWIIVDYNNTYNFNFKNILSYCMFPFHILNNYIFNIE